MTQAILVGWLVASQVAATQATAGSLAPACDPERIELFRAYGDFPSYVAGGSVEPHWLEGKSCVGITAGASAPELLVQNVVEYLQQNGAESASSLGFTEDVIISLPKQLRESAP